MLPKIKSILNVKKIFQFMQDKRKLKIIKYNKKIKNRLNIELIDYKRFTNRYIIYTENGKGKEYNGINNELLFYGTYLNGVRNGYGKEYRNSLKVFEGNFIKGIRNGYGKDYFDDRRIIFEGEYLNGKRWNGKGAKYYIDGRKQSDTRYDNGNLYVEIDEIKEGLILFVGETLNGIKNGKGKEYYGTKLLFEGEYSNGNRKKGKEYFNGKLEFEGEYLYNKKWEGKGYDINSNIIYELIKGKGKVKLYDKFNMELIYEGDYKDTLENGKGCQYNMNKKIFEGTFENGKRNGEGKEYDGNGLVIFEGTFKNGKRNGEGKEYDENGKMKFKGKFKNGKRNGEGKEYDENENMIFKGMFKNGEKNGEGKEYDAKKHLKFEGIFENGKRNGKGKEYGKNNNLLFEGEYINGKRKKKNE